MPRLVYVIVALASLSLGASRAAEEPGHHPEVKVSAGTRIDWVFTLSNQSPARPRGNWLPGYESTNQSYELYVPKSLKEGEPAGLMLFISPGERSSGFEACRQVCDDHNLLFASPHKAGNITDSKQRIRIVLDVLDDLRRKYTLDPDRTYIGGFSGGGRIACAVAFSLPEYFGGVLPVCAAGDLREEPWLRQRVIDRISVAHLTGEIDFNRAEVERFRGPLLAAVGVRSKVWVTPATGHAIPKPTHFDDAIRWLDAGVAGRRKLAEQYAASRAAADETPSRDEVAKGLLAEGKARLANKAGVYSGLMQIKGVLDRWPDLAAAEEAKAILITYEKGDDRAWEQEDIVQQRKYLIARARALTDYGTGPLPQQYKAQRSSMAGTAIRLWKMVIEDGQDEAAVTEGRKWLVELEKISAGSEK